MSETIPVFVPGIAWLLGDLFCQVLCPFQGKHSTIFRLHEASNTSVNLDVLFFFSSMWQVVSRIFYSSVGTTSITLSFTHSTNRALKSLYLPSASSLVVIETHRFLTTSIFSWRGSWPSIQGKQTSYYPSSSVITVSLKWSSVACSSSYVESVSVGSVIPNTSSLHSWTTAALWVSNEVTVSADTPWFFLLGTLPMINQPRLVSNATCPHFNLYICPINSSLKFLLLSAPLCWKILSHSQKSIYLVILTLFPKALSWDLGSSRIWHFGVIQEFHQQNCQPNCAPSSNTGNDFVFWI